MSPSEIEKIANIWLRQYRSIIALDKSRDMLVAKYGAQTFATIRKAMALLIIQPSNNDDIASTNETAKNSVVEVGQKPKGKRVQRDR